MENPKGESKQETIEEAAEKLFPIFNRSTPFGSKYPWTPKKERKAFERGAKWMQERMYSEKEVESLLHKYMQSQIPDWHGWSTTKWFEQYKKK